MNRLFVRKRTDRRTQKQGADVLEQRNIAVTGLGQCVGTTFVASSLAFFFREKGNSVTFCQCAQPWRCSRLFYDAVAMEQRFTNRRFTDFYALIHQEEKLTGKKNMDSGINWILPTPYDWDSGFALDAAQRNRLVLNVRDETVIFDLETHKDWDGFLQDMDQVVVVIDPMPSALIRASGRFSFLKRLELAGTPMTWIVNRMNSGVHRRQVTGYLKNRSPLWLEQMDSALIYADEFFCRYHWENEEIRCKFMELFTKLSQF